MLLNYLKYTIWKSKNYIIWSFECFKIKPSEVVKIKQREYQCQLVDCIFFHNCSSPRFWEKNQKKCFPLIISFYCILLFKTHPCAVRRGFPSKIVFPPRADKRLCWTGGCEPVTKIRRENLASHGFWPSWVFISVSPFLWARQVLLALSKPFQVKAWGDRSSATNNRSQSRSQKERDPWLLNSFQLLTISSSTAKAQLAYSSLLLKAALLTEGRTRKAKIHN